MVDTSYDDVDYTFEDGTRVNFHALWNELAWIGALSAAIWTVDRRVRRRGLSL